MGAPLRCLAFALALGALGAAAEPAAPPPELLVARTDLPEPFHDAVVLLTSHTAQGAIGVIVNHPTDIALAKVLPDEEKLADGDAKLFFGGPVASDVAVFIFRAARPPRGATRIRDDVYIGSSPELLHQLLARPKPMQGLRVYAGLAGWGPGQLESELDRGDWRRIAADARSLLDTPPESLWAELYRRAWATMVRNDVPVLRSDAR
jgi:putative transcriptional regulator